MLPKLGTSSSQKIKESGKSSSSKGAVGLRILVLRSAGESNAVVKQSMRITDSFGSIRTNSIKSQFLKSCSLCNKNLNPQEDIYMYRGDQGYCSKECRSRQIDIDERRELEASTKQILASFRRCHDGEPSETRLLLDDLRRRNRLPRPRIRAVVS